MSKYFKKPKWLAKKQPPNEDIKSNESSTTASKLQDDVKTAMEPEKSMSVVLRPDEEKLHEDVHQPSKITHSPTSMVLLFVLTLEAILVTVMESFVIYYHTMIFERCNFAMKTLGLAQADLIYHGIFIAAPIYQLFLYLDTLRQRNLFQLFTLLLFGILMVVFSGIQTIQHMIFEEAGCNLSYQNDNSTTFPNSTKTTTKATSSKIHMLVVINGTTPNFQDYVDAGVSNIKPFEYSILGVIAVAFIIMLGCSVKLYRLFQWSNYLSHTFRDNRLRNTLISWAILTGLLKIDLFFIFAYAVQLVPSAMIGYINIPAFECAIVFAVGLITYLIAVYSVRNEYMRILMVFNLITLGSIGYFGYRLYTFGIPRDARVDPFKLTRYDLIFTTLTLTLLMIMTLATSLVCFRNVFFNNVRILDQFQCICPTCYMHSSLTPIEVETSTAGPSSQNSIKPSLDLEIAPAESK